MNVLMGNSGEEAVPDGVQDRPIPPNHVDCERSGTK